MTCTHNLWDLFHAHFQLGQELIILDSDDKVFVGKYISVSEEGITLKSVFLGTPTFLDWTDVRFMAHDGFPVRKLMGADGSPSLEKEFMEGKNATDIIRAATMAEIQEVIEPVKKPKEDTEETVSTPMPRPRRRYRSIGSGGIVGGCPWMIDACEVEIVNPGNSLQTHWSLWKERYLRDYGYESGEWEEALVLTAPNGAKGQLFDFESIHHFAVEPEGTRKVKT